MIEGTAISKILYGILQWAFCIIVVFFIPNRIKGKKRILLIIGFLFLIIGFQWNFRTVTDNYLWVFSIIGIYALMFLFILLLGKVTWFQSIYLTTQAFIFAQFVAAFEWQMYYVIGPIFEYRFLQVIEYVLFIIMLVSSSVIMYVIYKHYHLKGYRLDIKRSDMITVLAIVIIVFIVSNFSFLGIDSWITSNYPHEIFYIRTLVDFCGVVVILVLQEYQIIMYAQKEITVLESTFHKYYNQYVESKENIELANQRYHDIKHQLAFIRAENDQQKKNEYLNNFEKEFQTYTVKAETGHGVIDTIVTSKKVLCNENNINLTYAIEGEKLKFMSTMDLTSFFGNMFDNAIESVKNIEDIDKRIINLKVYKQHQLLIINMENYYEHDLKYEDGKLLTTKAEAQAHGYGIKSIRNIVDKYEGTLRINTKENWFTITVLFTLDKNNE